MRLTLLCSADGKIRLATLELSCLLLKQQVVTSMGCIVKDVHLACLEVRAPSLLLPEPWGEEGAVRRKLLDPDHCPSWPGLGAHGISKQQPGLAAYACPMQSTVPVGLPFH